MMPDVLLFLCVKGMALQSQRSSCRPNGAKLPMQLEQSCCLYFLDVSNSFKAWGRGTTRRACSLSCTPNLGQGIEIASSLVLQRWTRKCVITWNQDSSPPRGRVLEYRKRRTGVLANDNTGGTLDTRICTRFGTNSRRNPFLCPPSTR